MPIKDFLKYLTILIFFVGGCIKDIPDAPILNQPPKTFLWLFPDSSINEGNSRQRIRWWGEDQDGIIMGYLFAAGKLFDTAITLQQLDTIAWRWKTTNDTVIAFPLLQKRDTFQIAVRAVDNSLTRTLPDQAVIRFSPTPFWDRNENGVFDTEDEILAQLSGATDPKGASLGIPILNQPPSLVFAPDPNDPSAIMQQPETTFTAVTFAWIGSDPDGDQTITSYEIALNDTAVPSRRIAVPGNVRLISLVVPRARSDTASVVADADVYSGTFSSTRRLRGTIPGLRLDNQNTFFIQARDIAGDTSHFIQMPTSPRKWYVKKPKSKLLIVSDFITGGYGNRDSVLSFYRQQLSQLPGGEYSNVDVIDIGRNPSPNPAQWKRDGKFGLMVPPFVDPALIFTLHLYDVVFWYTDPYPTLGVAQYPLFQYVRDVSHPGNVIYSTMFETSSDPRGALVDFSPLDSISSVDLTSNRLLPTMGDDRTPQGVTLLPDSSDVGNTFPALKILSNRIYSPVYLRSIYKRADAKYIYSMNEDNRDPLRYVFTTTLSELRSISAIEFQAWVCGASGVILHTSNEGVSWLSQRTGSNNTLNAIQFLDATKGWCVGENGTILQTSDGGVTWINRSVITFEHLLNAQFFTNGTGIVVGTNGLLIRTTNSGTSWVSLNSQTEKAIRDVFFVNENLGLAVGEGGLIIKTTDGGQTWKLIPPITSSRLNAVIFTNNLNCFAVGSNRAILKSTNAGETWSTQSSFPIADPRSIFFVDEERGWICGNNGAVYRTIDGGSTWSSLLTGIEQPSGRTPGQTLNGITLASSLQGWSVGSGGVIIHTENGGSSWSFQPAGNINVAVVDGENHFVFIGLPLHLLNGDGNNVKSFFEHVLFQVFNN
ncbi:MAG TPA: YCF48-related protein [Bacteroidota bacterium]|nr:YCF48-related protein [Bacteroidota bacterium]